LFSVFRIGFSLRRKAKRPAFDRARRLDAEFLRHSM
jgi:hypothetical protein